MASSTDHQQVDGSGPRVLIGATGSTGDVVPFVGLGVRLREAGYAVSVATYEMFGDLVREHGLGFRPLPGDPHALDQSEEGIDWQEGGGGLKSTLEFMRMMSGHMRELHEGFLAAARDADVLLLSGMLSLGGYHVGQALGIPSVGLHLQPVEPTRDFPPSGVPAWGRWSNRMAWNAMMTAGVGALYRPLKELRATLRLPEVSYGAVRREQREQHWPRLHGYSPLVLPRASDWRPGISVAGYWWPASRPGWQPPAELVDFLDSGPPPVFVGFGSRSFRDSERLSGIVADALRRAGQRGVVQSGWAGLGGDGSDILSIGEIPHEWLFPRMAAVVHHAGAGTTAAGLRAGVPAVGVPVIADQPFWSARLRALGVSPGTAPYKGLQVDQLASLVDEAVHNPQLRARAQKLGQRIGAEDGVAPVLHTVKQITR